MVILSQSVQRAIADHATRAYPDECVGLLLGHLDGTTKQAVAVVAVENRWAGQVQLSDHDDPHSRRERFYLDPHDYMRADDAAQQQGLDVVGCYHSHPDHPPHPSERDRVGARGIAGPSFAFLIQAVAAGHATHLTAWTLPTPDDGWVAESLEIAAL